MMNLVQRQFVVANELLNGGVAVRGYKGRLRLALHHGPLQMVPLQAIANRSTGPRVASGIVELRLCERDARPVGPRNVLGLLVGRQQVDADNLLRERLQSHLVSRHVLSLPLRELDVVIQVEPTSRDGVRSDAPCFEELHDIFIKLDACLDDGGIRQERVDDGCAGRGRVVVGIGLDRIHELQYQR